MVTKTQEAPSVLAREDILRRIPQFEIRPIFTREHLNRELVIGLIGLRGDGKSASSASIGLLDYLLVDKPVWSNMEIKCDLKVSDNTAKKYGLNYGGIAHFESQPLIKNALLSLDERYRNGALVIEEINVEYSNVRRFMTNTNVDFNLVCQQLRKFGTSLIYNVIDEMFIDSQLRGLTDIFIKTEDIAFDMDALINKKALGEDFRWNIYPMSGWVAGREAIYSRTHRPLNHTRFHFTPLRGIYDSTQYQHQGRYSISTKEKNQMMEGNLSMKSSPELTADMNKWGWLAQKAQELKNRKVKTIDRVKLAQFIGRPITKEMRSWLATWGIAWDNPDQVYIIEDFEFEQTPASVLA